MANAKHEIMWITQVGSDRDPDIAYKVGYNVTLGRFECECDSFRFNKKRDTEGCKHIQKMMGIATKVNSCLALARQRQKENLKVVA